MMGYEKKKKKKDIELNIMLLIAIIAITIFVITMIITFINVYNKQKNNELENINSNEDSNIYNQQNINNESNNQESTEDITANKSEQEITNEYTRGNEESIISNKSESSINDDINKNNVATNTGKYSNDETIPFKLNGGKIVSGDLQTGLTIQDINGNEWVWIEVPKSVTKNANTNDEIEKALEEYTKSDIIGQNLIMARNGCTDSNYEGTGMTDENYINKKNKMLKTIKNNGGFYIGKYETGYNVVSQNNIRSGKNTSTEYPTNEKPLIKKNLNPYNWVNCKQAENLSESLATDGRNTSLLFGIQWDLVIKYLNNKGINKYYLIENSTKWGNYSNNENKKILKTGNDNYTAPMGIYDLSGNVWEWTLEKSAMSSIPSIVRGGAFNTEGTITPASYRGSVRLNLCNSDVGFRCTLY